MSTEKHEMSKCTYCKNIFSALEEGDTKACPGCRRVLAMKVEELSLISMGILPILIFLSYCTFNLILICVTVIWSFFIIAMNFIERNNQSTGKRYFWWSYKRKISEKLFLELLKNPPIPGPDGEPVFLKKKHTD